MLPTALACLDSNEEELRMSFELFLLSNISRDQCTVFFGKKIARTIV